MPVCEHRSKALLRSTLAAMVGSSAWLFSVPSFAAVDQPLLVVTGDFDGDGELDRVQGYPEASNGAGRVDVFWGDPGFKVAWPTVLSALKDPATLLASGRLGESLAVGDFNGDGLDDLAIGAPHTDLEIKDPTDPTLRLELIEHLGSVVLIYGCAAAPCSAVDGNGAGRLAVGSPLDPSSAAGAQRLQPQARVSFARFGKSLAAGNFNGDPYDDLAIGSPGDTVGGAVRAGSVTIFHGSASGLALPTRQVIQQGLLGAISPAEAEDHFGASLSAARLDNDATDDLVVGVPDEDYGEGADEQVSAGEVDVFWGGAAGISGLGAVRFRHTVSMSGGGRSGDRLGHEVQGIDGPGSLSGSLRLGLAEATSCPAGAILFLSASMVDAEPPFAVLVCNPDLCVDDPDNPSSPGDGALPEIPVNFIVLANGATGATDPPTAASTRPDPITGVAITGADYFKSMIDLLNQQLRADDGNPICQGQDCLRLTYRSHHFYRPDMFEGACRKLAQIARPPGTTADGETELNFTTNCEDFAACPWWVPPTGDQPGLRYPTFSDFAQAAVDECTLLAAPDALNVLIYDVCERDAVDGRDVQDCPGSAAGRGRSNQDHPYFFVDYARALQPRAFRSSAFPWAAEEHEAGHAFGLQHACDCVGHEGDTHTMQTPDCDEGLGSRNRGFATHRRFDETARRMIEVEEMIRTAREAVKAWCP